MKKFDFFQYFSVFPIEVGGNHIKAYHNRQSAVLLPSYRQISNLPVRELLPQPHEMSSRDHFGTFDPFSLGQTGKGPYA